VRIIKLIPDVDFDVLRKDNPFEIDEEKIRLSFTHKHGYVMYAAGLFEDDEDMLMCLGSEDCKHWRWACYDGFRDFENGWYDLVGKPHLKPKVPANIGDIGRVEYT